MELAVKTHFALLNSAKKPLNFNEILPKNKSIGIFSEAHLFELVEKEVKHEKAVVESVQSLRSMSNGERKMALLQHLINRKPAILWIESLYENLDSKNRSKVKQLIEKAAATTQIVQVVKREEELLSFIKKVFYVNKKNILTPFLKPISHFFKQKEIVLSTNIPEGITPFSYNYRTFVKLEKVSVHYLNKPILKDISWEIKAGEFWQLIGENGSGKTTLLSLITGDNPKAYGQNIILFDKLKGTEENIWEIKQKIGYFTPNITELFSRRHCVIDMILSGFYDSIGLYVKPQGIHIALAKKWLKLAEMEAFEKNPFTTLSLSQQRIVMIIRAMVKQPPLLILDEPASGVDSKSKSLITAFINKLIAKTKTTVIYVSHIPEKGLLPSRTFKLEKDILGSKGNVIV